MEANRHAFQATAHKCDPPVNGHYTSCDRGGCGENTRDLPRSYGPGPEYTIDTTLAFEVRTIFMEEGSRLVGMRTELHQAERKVLLNHTACGTQYFNDLSAAFSTGLSLRMAYWGDTADQMAWMDSPPCGRQACSASGGYAVVKELALGPIPVETQPPSTSTTLLPTSTTIAATTTISHSRSALPPKISEQQGDVQADWVVDDSSDALNGRAVPETFVQDAERFVSLENRGVVKWKGSEHFVKRLQTHEVSDGEASVHDDSVDGSHDSSAQWSRRSIMTKYQETDLHESGMSHQVRSFADSHMFTALLFAPLLVVLIACRTCASRVQRSAQSGEMAQGAHECRATGNTATVVSSGRPGSVEVHASELAASARISGGGLVLTRSGSSCQRLVAMDEGQEE